MDGVVKIKTTGKANEIVLDYKKLRKSALILRALNHELRQRIIELLNDENPMVVTDIYVKLRVEQSVASQHLAILRKAGIVEAKRNGKYIHYQLNHNRIEEINNFIEIVSN